MGDWPFYLEQVFSIQTKPYFHKFVHEELSFPLWAINNGSKNTNNN